MKALRLVLPMLLLAVLWQWLDGPAILARLLRADPLWLLAAMAAGVLQIPLLALRWRLTAGALGQELGLGLAVREYFVAQLVNQTLPGGMLGDAARVLRTKGEAGVRLAGQAVVIERLAGQFALFMVTLAGVALTMAWPGPVRWPSAADEIAGWSLAAGLGLLAGLALLARMRPELAGRIARPVQRSVLAREVWPRQLGLGLGVVACNLATFAFAARAIGIDIPGEAVVTLVPLVMTAMLIPLSIAGWGFREGAAAALLPIAGIAPEPAVAASIVFGAVILLASLPGVFWLAPPDMSARD